jgi:hypothetical protein
LVKVFSDKGNVAGVNPGDENNFWPSVNGVSWNAYLLPYLPYFSSCRGFDSHIPLFLLLESEVYCNLVAFNSTVFIDQWNFISSPSALQVESAMDSCSWNIPCLYEEEISKVKIRFESRTVLIKFSSGLDNFSLV